MHYTLEDHLDKVCPKCKKEHHGKWKPRFHLEMHYKTLKCDCGYEVCQEPPFTEGWNEAKLLPPNGISGS